MLATFRLARLFPELNRDSASFAVIDPHAHESREQKALALLIRIRDQLKSDPQSTDPALVSAVNSKIIGIVGDWLQTKFAEVGVSSRFLQDSVSLDLYHKMSWPSVLSSAFFNSSQPDPFLAVSIDESSVGNLKFSYQIKDKLPAAITDFSSVADSFVQDFGLPMLPAQ